MDGLRHCICSNGTSSTNEEKQGTNASSIILTTRLLLHVVIHDIVTYNTPLSILYTGVTYFELSEVDSSVVRYTYVCKHGP